MPSRLDEKSTEESSAAACHKITADVRWKKHNCKVPQQIQQ